MSTSRRASSEGKATEWWEARKLMIDLEAMSRHLAPPKTSRDGCGKCLDADTIDAAIATIRELIEENTRIRGKQPAAWLNAQRSQP